MTATATDCSNRMKAAILAYFAITLPGLRPCGDTVPSHPVHPRRTERQIMASTEECREALNRFAARLAEGDSKSKGRSNFERRLACDVTDLNASFHGRFSRGKLVDIEDGDDRGAEIRMTVSSDDLVALVDEELDFTNAFTSGRVKIKASFMDLLKLKGML